jgi:integrase/recombinase XerD
MKTHFHLIFDPNAGTGYSPYRLLDGTGSPVRIINEFLDAQAIRSLSPRSLRAYGFDLLNFATWWAARRKRSSLQSLTQSHLLEYVRHQLTLKPRPTAQTVNHRLTVLRCLYRFHSGSDIPWSRSSVVTSYKTQNPLGYGRPTHGVTGLKLKQTRRVVIPLSAEEVLRFWKSFRTYRDISIVTLMLADGLRSREVLALHCSDLVLSQACLRVSGKGNKERILPLSEETLETINQYVHVERPITNASSLFVSLKGRRRGQPMTPAGLRSLFRHHRKKTGIAQANPHRFRHTFGADMVRAGVSLPALMHLMGHANIQTTLLYTELSREDVWQQYRMAVRKLHQKSRDHKSTHPRRSL